MMGNTYVPADSHGDIVRGVGLVAIAWSVLEFQIQMVIWSFLSVDENHGLSTTAHIDHNLRVDIALTLARPKLPKDDYLALRALLNKSKTIKGQRNDVVHGLWIQDGSPAQSVACKFVARGNLAKVANPYTPQKLETLVNEITTLTEQIERFLADRGIDFPPTNEIWRKEDP